MRALGVQGLLVAACAFLLGLMLGGLEPRANARALQVKLEACEARPCSPADLGTDLARMFAGRAFEPTATPAAPQPSPRPRAQVETTDEAPRGPALVTPVPVEPRVEVVRPDTEDGDATDRGPARDVDAMRDMMNLRQKQVRASLIEDAAPDDAQLASIDDAVGDMNDALYGLAEDFAERVRMGEEPTRREAMEFAADTLDVMLTAEDRIVDSLDDDQLADVDPGVHDPFSWVDSSIVDVFMDLPR